MNQTRHHLRLVVSDRPGAIEAIAAAFSVRGQSLDSFHAILRDTRYHAAPGTITLSFRASLTRQRLMLRVLRRLPMILAAEPIAETEGELPA